MSLERLWKIVGGRVGLQRSATGLQELWHRRWNPIPDRLRSQSIPVPLAAGRENFRSGERADPSVSRQDFQRRPLFCG